ncbi:hypothetical protein lerEdw1_009667 [Lerista edwardsae]|nr:hypothetical protein lerEdw1_009667 [Lerista edwardsae]
MQVDGIRTSLPISLNNGMLRVSRRGTFILLATDVRLRVLYDCSHQLYVTIPGTYHGSVCGLCGNYNGEPADDFQTPAGTVAPSATGFGASWSLSSGNESCWHDCHGACQPCPPSLAEQYAAESYCGLISTNGSFAPCHGKVKPTTFFEGCVHDLCSTGGHKLSLCNSLKAYTDACQRVGVRIGEWRRGAECPLECPPNSHYQLCGTACPATCVSDEADIPCPDACVEGCQCREGFVLSQGNCIPKSSCGCLYEGRPYAVNESFWADEACGKRCVCTAAKREVKCAASACKPSERCRVVEGFRGCYPTNYSTCHASWGLHYLTFDKRKFDFQGTCAYVLTEVCHKPPELERFSIYVQSKHSGSHIVSIHWSVQVNVLSDVLIASRRYPDRILVNGLLTYLPYSTAGGRISTFRKGCHLVIQADFGLTVLFDWDNSVTVTVPSTYADTLCGLCGNFNGSPADDAPVPGSILAPSEPIFGIGAEASASNCSEIIDPQCPDLEVIAGQQRASGQDCGLILAKDGPFRECHGRVDQEAHFRDCVYNYCQFQRRHALICAGVASYATDCQAAKVAIQAWRSSHFCPPSCPPNSHYELCSRDCSRTCSSLYLPTPCLPTCKEGCVCNEDFAMSNGRCVPVAQCGCFYKGHYYPVGDAFYPDCQEHCVCQSGGNVACVVPPCGPQEECKAEDGIRKCHPIQNATCSAAGSAHYLSFDGLPFDFHGTCTYVLAKAHKVKGDLIPFTVIVENEAGENRTGVKLVSVEVYGIVLTLLQEKRGLIKSCCISAYLQNWKVVVVQTNASGLSICKLLFTQEMLFSLQVNGVLHPLPVTLSSGQLRVTQHRDKITVETAFGLVVSDDLLCRVRVTVPNIYQDQMGGLCGNYNGQKDDEFQLPDGSLASDVVTFGASWKILIPGVSCTDECLGGNCSICKKGEVFKQRDYCGLLTACDGPFRACHAVVSPTVYLSNCVFDLCRRDGNRQALCQNIQSYVIACQEAKVSIQPWRNSSFCPIHCPANSHYAICPDVYNTTCVGIKDHTQFPEACIEGCQCDDGFFFDGLQCISMNECGCFREGQYFPPNKRVLLINCTERCTCSPAEGLVCVPHACLADEACEVKNGTMQCSREDPCKAIMCRPKETCRTEEDQPVCVPQYVGTCWVWGGQHYRTFDGFDYDLHGTCTYVLVQSEGSMNGLVPFSVEEKNENRGVSDAMQQIIIHVYEHKITISKRELGRIRVNDVLHNLPITLDGGLVSASWRSNSTVVHAQCGLVVTFHWDRHVQITLPSSYYNHTGGLCGNFNRLAEDEWVGPDGTPWLTLYEWADAWVVKDGGPPCFHQCQGECRTCGGPDLARYRAEDQCGVITAPEGPFQSCHSVLNPKMFLHNCASDTCLNEGDHAVLCQAISSYAHACHHEGQSAHNWRIPTECPFSCPTNSHYEACGTACPASCSDSTAPSSCKEPCVETCQCNEGFILSVDQCVPVGSCGCTYHGLYYKPGEEFWAGEGCELLCRCHASQGTAACHPGGCKASQECTVVHGVRGCHSTHLSTCTASGDYSYSTFDGQRFKFNGTCLYQLAGVCSANSTLVPFNVFVQNSPPPDGHVVICLVHGVSITLHAGSGDKMQLNDTVVDLPFSLEEKIHVNSHGSHLAVVVDIGLTISVWKENLTVVVSVPGNYVGHLCGLCGNANGNSSSDKSGEFGERWRVGCAPGCSPDCPPCTAAERQSYQEDGYCGLLLNRFGPLAACLGAIPSQNFFKECVSKTCQVRGRQPVWCDVIASYAAVCQAKNFPLKKWRTEAFCQGRCRLMPGAWFSSFDGLSGKVPDFGTYELTSLCDAESGDWFRVLVRVASCPANATLAITTVYVFFKGAFIAVQGQKEAWVNGLPVPIPSKVGESVTLDLDSQGIILRLSQVKVILSSEGGAMVMITPALAGKVCGACGNFNDNQTDDMMGPGGLELSSVEGLLVSWIARDFTHW